MEAIIKGQSYDVKDGILNYHGQQLVIDQGRDEQLYITAKTSEGVFETLSLDAIAESADPVVLTPQVITEAMIYQLNSAQTTCEGRIMNGADIPQCFIWLYEDTEQILQGIQVYEID